MLNKCIVTLRADRLETYARTILGNRKYDFNTYNDYKNRIKKSRNEMKVKEHIS